MSIKSDLKQHFVTTLLPLWYLVSNIIMEVVGAAAIFTVVCLVAWCLNEKEPGGNLVFKETPSSLLFS